MAPPAGGVPLGPAWGGAAAARGSWVPRRRRPAPPTGGRAGVGPPAGGDHPTFTARAAGSAEPSRRWTPPRPLSGHRTPDPRHGARPPPASPRPYAERTLTPS